jgi:hypothetical protein
MQFFMNTAVLALAALSSFSAAAPLQERSVETRDVFVPPVTYPHAGTHWNTGETHHVKW